MPDHTLASVRSVCLAVFTWQASHVIATDLVSVQDGSVRYLQEAHGQGLMSSIPTCGAARMKALAVVTNASPAVSAHGGGGAAPSSRSWLSARDAAGLW